MGNIQMLGKSDAWQVKGQAPKGLGWGPKLPYGIVAGHSLDFWLASTAHQAGTIRFGTDPSTSALDVHCKAHYLDNLHVVDGTSMPFIGAVNLTLTIIANAIRVAEHVVTPSPDAGQRPNSSNATRPTSRLAAV